MATTALIAVKINNHYKVIHLGSDGYLNYCGRILQSFYNSQDLARNLIEQGDMSFLDKNTEKTDFYHRDYKKEWIDVKPRIARTHRDILGMEHGQDYFYIFENGGWLVEVADEFIEMQTMLTDIN